MTGGEREISKTRPEQFPAILKDIPKCHFTGTREKSGLKYSISGDELFIRGFISALFTNIKAAESRWRAQTRSKEPSTFQVQAFDVPHNKIIKNLPQRLRRYRFTKNEEKKWKFILPESAYKKKYKDKSTGQKRITEDEWGNNGARVINGDKHGGGGWVCW